MTEQDARRMCEALGLCYGKINMFGECYAYSGVRGATFSPFLAERILALLDAKESAETTLQEVLQTIAIADADIVQLKGIIRNVVRAVRNSRSGTAIDDFLEAALEGKQ